MAGGKTFNEWCEETGIAGSTFYQEMSYNTKGAVKNTTKRKGGIQRWTAALFVV